MPSKRPTRIILRLLAQSWPLWALAALTVAFFWKIALTNRILAGIDVFTFFYPYRAFATEALRSGRPPLWNPHLFLGAPFFADSQAGVLYPLNLLLASLPVPSQVSYSIVIHTALGGLFAYLFARQSLRIGQLGALVTASVFALGGFLGAQAEHVNQLSVSVWLPLMLLLWDKARLWEPAPTRERLLRAFWPLSGLAGVIAVTLLAGHAQALYICMVGLGLFALWPGGPIHRRGRGERRNLEHESNERTRKKSFALFAVFRAVRVPNVSAPSAVRVLVVLAGLGAAAVTGLATAGVQLLPTAELSALSLRGSGLTYREAVSFSLRPRLLLTALFPAYRTGVFSEYIAYTGIVAMALAVVAFWRSSNRRGVRVLSVMAALGLFLALGGFNPVYYVLYKVVPGFDLFRAPARWMLLYAFGVAALAGLGIDSLQAKGRWRPVLWTAGAAILVFSIGAIWMERPSLAVAGIWLASAVFAAAMLWLSTRRRVDRYAPALLAAGVLLELFVASRSLAYNHPTAPQAYTSLRPSVAHILADPERGRVLSLSDLVFDPGDLREIETIYGQHLPPDSLYDYVVATKQKDVLAPNLPTVYGISSLDGYGGGILPLRSYYEIERLFLPEDRLSPDGRLREGLTEIPDGRLLGAFGVKYILADKAYDVWQDGVYYDLSHRAVLRPGESVSLTLSPGQRFPADAIGIVSYFEGLAGLPDGTPVAELVLHTASGQRIERALLAGRDTAEGDQAVQTAHARPAVAGGVRGQPGIAGYLSTLPLPQFTEAQRISITMLADSGSFVIRGASLISRATGTHLPLVLSTFGDFRLVHSGDVKIYLNGDAKPRLYAAYKAETAESNAHAIARMRSEGFDPTTTIVVTGGAPLTGEPGGGESVSVIVNEAERVAADVHLAAPAYVVLNETRYPGWRATVDGVQAPIHTANGMVSAVLVPAGDHEVAFVFRPDSLRAGVLCSATALALWAILALGVIGYRRHRPTLKRSG